MIITKGVFPKKWKLGQIYLIPKNVNWEHNLASTRPIMLLETFRKLVVRIIQKRLCKVIVQKKILKGANFAGLPEESTMAPIHILNNVIEDAIQKNNELWIAFQDMRKAFDSVSMTALELAMKRIQFPEKLITFIKYLYKDHKIRVITEKGPTSFFTASDGIDQGEVISLLMWRIFYDLLLVRIQQAKLGYQMCLEWPSDISKNITKVEKIEVSALAYADDTT